MQRLAAPEPLVQLPGERDEMIYLPLGVGVVIPPWNFPLAILGGHDGRGAGDRQYRGHQAFERNADHRREVRRSAARSRIPGAQSSACCTGSGAAVGDLLVEHPKTRFVSFTGSRDVGLRINELAAKPRKGQIWIKRVIAEMGGKDAIIVDREADLDSAVDGRGAVRVRLSGPEVLGLFARDRGRSGLRRVSREARKRRSRRSRWAPPDDPANYMGPVISAGAQEVDSRIHRDRQEGRPAGRGRRAGAGRRLFHPAHRDRRRRFQGAHLSGRDFRTGAGGDQGARFRSRAASWPTIRSTASPARSIRTIPKKSARRASSSSSAICISTGNAPARWWARIRLADSICRARIRRRAVRITCCCSCKPSRSPRSFSGSPIEKRYAIGPVVCYWRRKTASELALRGDGSCLFRCGPPKTGWILASTRTKPQSRPAS